MRFLAVIIFVGMLSFSGCGGSGGGNVSTPASEMTAGEKLFRMNCSSCHAMGFGFRSIDGLAKHSKALQSDEAFLGFIRAPQSVGQYNMPSFRESEISDDDSQALYAWLKETYVDEKKPEKAKATEPLEKSEKIPEPAEMTEDKTVSLVLLYAGKNELATIKAVRAITGLGLEDSKYLVDQAPFAIQTGLTKEEAKKAKETLEAAGAMVEIKND